MSAEEDAALLNRESSQWAAEFERENMQIASRNSQANWMEQFEKQIVEWTRQFMLENEEYEKRQYRTQELEFQQWLRTQSPKALMKYAAEAGIAPAAMLQHMGMSGASAGSAAPVSGKGVPSPSGAGTGVAGATALPTPGFSDIQELAAAVNAIANAGSSFAGQVDTISQLNSNIKLKMSEAQYNDFRSSFQGMYNQVYAATGSKAATANIMKTISEAYYAAEQGKSEQSERLLNGALSDLHKVQTDSAREELPFIKQRAENTINLLKEQSNTERAKQHELSTQSDLNVQNKLLAEQNTGLVTLERQWEDYNQKAKLGQLTEKEETEYSRKLRESLIAELHASEWKSYAEREEATQVVDALQHETNFASAVNRGLRLLRIATRGK